MCWFHDWKYFGRDLRTCRKCGLHENRTRDFEGCSWGWDIISCKLFAELMKEFEKGQKEKMKEEEQEQLAESKCEYHGQMSVKRSRRKKAW